MEVILREDVDNLGRAGEMVQVRDGYGRNYLLPRGLAVRATSANKRQLAAEQAAISARQAKLKATAQEQSKKLEALTVRIKRKAGEQDKLFGSVTALDIAEGLIAQGQKIDRRHIHLPEPIKTVGKHEVELRLHREIVAKIRVEVAAE